MQEYIVGDFVCGRGGCLAAATPAADAHVGVIVRLVNIEHERLLTGSAECGHILLLLMID